MTGDKKDVIGILDMIAYFFIDFESAASGVEKRSENGELMSSPPPAPPADPTVRQQGNPPETETPSVHDQHD